MNLTALPDELLLHILLFVDGREISQTIARLSKRFFHLAEEPHLWRSIILAECPSQSVPKMNYPNVFKAVWHAWAMHKHLTIHTIEDQIGRLYMGPRNKLNEYDGCGIFCRVHPTEKKCRRNVYIGYWSGGNKHGHGWLWCGKKGYYEGGWAHNLRDGRGDYRWSINHIYRGEWMHGETHGYGHYQWDPREQYVGVWKAGKMNGYGEYYWADGKRYRGHWVDDMLSGTGQFDWPDGRRYRGAWERGSRMGDGHFIFPDGASYKGSWIYGLRDGYGIQVWADGTTYDGVWVNDRPVDNTDEERPWRRFFCLTQREQYEMITQS